MNRGRADPSVTYLHSSINVCQSAAEAETVSPQILPTFYSKQEQLFLL